MYGEFYGEFYITTHYFYLSNNTEEVITSQRLNRDEMERMVTHKLKDPQIRSFTVTKIPA